MSQNVLRKITGKCYCNNKQNTIVAEYTVINECGSYEDKLSFVGLESYNEMCSNCPLDSQEQYDKCDVIRKAHGL